VSGSIIFFPGGHAQYRCSALIPSARKRVGRGAGIQKKRGEFEPPDAESREAPSSGTMEKEGEHLPLPEKYQQQPF